MTAWCISSFTTTGLSVYLEMASVLQLYNVFRNRCCGAYWASQGLRVVPTVNWGDETTFDFCFEGIEKGSVVAVSTYMASAHDNRCEQKEWFLTGYREMLQRIEPMMFRTNTSSRGMHPAFTFPKITRKNAYARRMQE